MVSEFINVILIGIGVHYYTYQNRMRLLFSHKTHTSNILADAGPILRSLSFDQRLHVAPVKKVFM